jgi:hypothetical protein
MAACVREDMWERVMREWREDDRKRSPPSPPPPSPPLSDYEQDDRDTEKQLNGSRSAIAELHFERTAPAIWARHFEPGRYPRLHLARGKRAGRVGADRFRGRYVPHPV